MRLTHVNCRDEKNIRYRRYTNCKDSRLRPSSSAPASPAEYAKQSRTTAHHPHHTASTADHKASGTRRLQKPSQHPQIQQGDPS